MLLVLSLPVGENIPTSIPVCVGVCLNVIFDRNPKVVVLEISSLGW